MEIEKNRIVLILHYKCTGCVIKNSDHFNVIVSKFMQWISQPVNNVRSNNGW